jgi:hypothetical protein
VVSHHRMGNGIVLLHMGSYWARHDTPEVSTAKYGSIQVISIVGTWEFDLRGMKPVKSARTRPHASSVSSWMDTLSTFSQLSGTKVDCRGGNGPEYAVNNINRISFKAIARSSRARVGDVI